ncbi:antitoxin Xre/MbcA/ParS toxin-binding domain-containing protein [Allopusillimonas ginsengisoli]|uniref:antitoxin Xre/MbcA/ParS toxin-binding domain-containing protein n=1 Tax=Allopusillimonas ginsengisoli TaxID=453575 RepID=UPI00101F7B01|nr:antitoxin Xre/MbcA/ParS toxin-binding domain-containing protein [Allopusillimonas ginsengisoli]TEA71918.1 DUF2384 domain-containing protein [Allopusillimonas ginsengisoli]
MTSSSAKTTSSSPRSKAAALGENAALLLLEGDDDAARTASYLNISSLDPADEIRMVRFGVPARMIDALAGDMWVSRSRLLDWIKMPEATAKRKIKNDELLDTSWSERVLALASLIGQVQHMVEESGDPNGFDAPNWVGQWLSEPNPAFGGVPPGTYMDTEKGSNLVSQMLLQMQSGAYA